MLNYYFKVHDMKTLENKFRYGQFLYKYFIQCEKIYKLVSCLNFANVNYCFIYCDNHMEFSSKVSDDFS